MHINKEVDLMDDIHFTVLLYSTICIHDRLDRLSEFEGQEAIINQVKEDWFKQIKYINKKTEAIETKIAKPLIQMLDDHIAILNKERSEK